MKSQTICNRIFRYIFILLLITYLTLYFSFQAGYQNYENRQKNVLTEEKIKQFEEDVKNGKNIKVEDYLEDTYVDYSNSMSRFGKKVSLKVSSAVKSGIETVFSKLNQIVDD